MDYKIPSHEIVEAVRLIYPVGCRVRLLSMDDFHAPPPGTEGTVDFVDDTATVHTKWDNGSRLGALYQVDCIEKI